MATLLETAAKLGSLTAKYAPKKTGNLQKKLREYNTGRNILGGKNSAQAEKQIIEDLKKGTYSLQFDIEVGPPGAEYGIWWNTPTVSNTVKNQTTGNKDKINFAEKAYQSPEFQKVLDDYTKTLAAKVADYIAIQIEKELTT
jgi:hypothetical protein